MKRHALYLNILRDYNFKKYFNDADIYTTISFSGRTTGETSLRVYCGSARWR
jgi:hypothetical protein